MIEAELNIQYDAIHYSCKKIIGSDERDFTCSAAWRRDFKA